MAKPIRSQNKVPSAARCFFVTSTTRGRRPTFACERLARLFIDVLYQYRRSFPYLLHEFTVMPDHFHALLTIGAGLTIEQAVQRIKGGYSFRVRKELGSPSEIWERGFTDHRIRDDQDFEIHRKYILNNAVKRGLVTSPDQYPYCSAYPGFEVDRATPPGAKALSIGASGRHD